MSAEEMAEAMYPESEITYGYQAVREAFEYGYAAAQGVQGWPSVEEVARAVSEPHSPVGGGWQAAYPGGLLESRCVCGVTLMMTRAEYADGRGGPIWADHVRDSRADAVLALFAQQPTVAEVKAEALREGARHYVGRMRAMDPNWRRVEECLNTLAADIEEADVARIEREARP